MAERGGASFTLRFMQVHSGYDLICIREFFSGDGELVGTELKRRRPLITWYTCNI